MKRIVTLVAPALAMALALWTGSSTAYPVPFVDAKEMTGLAMPGTHYVEVAPGAWLAVWNDREWRNPRCAPLEVYWSDDQKAVASEQGFPHHRWRDLYTNRLTETWFYPDVNRQYVFEVASGELLRSTRR